MHPVTRNLNRVFAEFVSSIDTVSGNPEIKKSMILTTSPYARRVKSPSSVSLENINNPPARELFNESFIPVGVIYGRIFYFCFSKSDDRAFGNFSIRYGKQKVHPTKMVVIADGDLIAKIK